MNFGSGSQELGTGPSAPERFARARPLLGTLVEISVFGLPQDEAHAAISRAFARVETVHALMSFQSPDSELTRINCGAFREAIAVSPQTWAVLQTAQAVSRASGGLFDITVAGTLVEHGLLPRPEGCIGPWCGRWDDVLLLEGCRVRFARNLCVDLSGIAKGYAVDQAVASLQDLGARGGLVNAGGDLRCFGRQSHRVHVRHPLFPTQIIPLLDLKQRALATSAHYYTRREHQGAAVSMLLQPGRNNEEKSDLSVSVLAPSCMLADALTKVVHADRFKALDVLPQFGADALLIEPDASSGACRVLDTRAGTGVVADEEALLSA